MPRRLLGDLTVREAARLLWFVARCRACPLLRHPLIPDNEPPAHPARMADRLVGAESWPFMAWRGRLWSTCWCGARVDTQRGPVT